MIKLRLGITEDDLPVAPATEGAKTDDDMSLLANADAEASCMEEIV
jgi:hypothetical protein